MSESPVRLLLLLTLAGLCVRVGFLLLEPQTQPIADERTWTDWAVLNLVTPRVRFSPFRNHMIFYPPLYHYFIAVFYELFGTLTAVKWAQAAVSALIVPAVGRAGWLVFGPRAGVAAAAAVAFYPELVWFSVHFWSETLFMALLWWAFERLLAADARGSLGAGAVAGLLWGLAVLTRETALYFTPLAALWLAWRRGFQGLARGAAFLLLAVVTVAPWTYRNWVVFDAFVPVSTAGGLNLWQGNAKLTRQEVYDLYYAVPGRIEEYRNARRMGIQAILDRQPWWFFEKLRDEMPRFWEADSLALIHIQRGAYGDVRPVAAVAAALVVLLPYLAALAFFVAGAAAVPAQRGPVLLILFLVFYNLLHVTTHGFARYRLPAMPVVFLLAAFAWTAWRAGQYPAPGQHRKAIAAVLSLALLAILVPSIRSGLREPAYGLVEESPPGSEEAPQR